MQQRGSGGGNKGAGPEPTPAISDVVALVAGKKRVSPRLLTCKDRCRNSTAKARHIAMYLSHVACGHTITDIAQVFGRNRTTVSQVCARIEDMRDDARFDAEVGALELVLEAAQHGG